MVSLSQRQGVGREADGDWLTPLRTFVRDTLGGEVKLSYRQLHMLLGTVWKMVLTQKSKSEPWMKTTSDQVKFSKIFILCCVAAVTEDLLAAMYSYYQQRHLTLQSRSLLLSFYSKIYLQEQGQSHITR